MSDQAQQFDSLKQTVRLLSNVLESKSLSSDEASGLVKVLADYTYALDVLDKYDHRALSIQATHKTSSFIVTYDEAMKAIHGLRDKRIADNALVALTLMIAESKPDEKDIMTQVVVNLINGYN